MRSIYSWNAGSLQRVGAVSDAHLRAWEYEVATEQSWTWTAAEQDLRDSVRLWKTRRPDLAPPELWVGDTEH
jgi:hypothetical protein